MNEIRRGKKHNDFTCLLLQIYSLACARVICLVSLAEYDFRSFRMSKSVLEFTNGQQCVIDALTKFPKLLFAVNRNELCFRYTSIRVAPHFALFTHTHTRAYAKLSVINNMEARLCADYTCLSHFISLHSFPLKCEIRL